MGGALGLLQSYSNSETKIMFLWNPLQSTNMGKPRPNQALPSQTTANLRTLKTPHTER